MNPTQEQNRIHFHYLKRNHSRTFVILIVSNIILIGSVGYLYLKNRMPVTGVYVDEQMLKEVQREAIESEGTGSDSQTNSDTIVRQEQNMKTYTNDELGISIQYPEIYYAKVDPAGENSILKLYSGGQSYDLVVQVWDSEKELKEAYADSPTMLERIEIRKINKWTVSFLNTNNTPEVDKIIKSVKY